MVMIVGWVLGNFLGNVESFFIIKEEAIWITQSNLTVQKSGLIILYGLILQNIKLVETNYLLFPIN